MLKKIILFIGLLLLSTNAYCLDLSKLKVYFLEGDYKAAITEGEKIMAKDASASHSDEFYYFLGLSYLKDANYLRASDIFEIIINEFKNSSFKEEAKLGLGDTYFLRGDFSKAEECYKDLINNNPGTKLKAQVYYRLSQVGFKKGNIIQGQDYLSKLKQEFPLSPEARLNKDLSVAPDSLDVYYTVQVGSFSSSVNAQNLKQKLIRSGYPAYIEETAAEGKNSYRVRVGKTRLRQEAVDLENKLSQEGYPTKIFP